MMWFLFVYWGKEYIQSFVLKMTSNEVLRNAILEVLFGIEVLYLLSYYCSKNYNYEIKINSM